MSKRVNEVSKVLQKYAVPTDLESVKQLKPRNSVSISANITVVGKVLGLTEKTYFRVSQRAEFEHEIKELFRESPGGKYHKSYDPTSTGGKNQIRHELYSLGISILEGGGASIADSLFPVNGLELYFVIYTQQEADEIREKKKRANPGSGGATRNRKKVVTTASPALAPIQPTTPALLTCHQPQAVSSLSPLQAQTAGPAHPSSAAIRSESTAYPSVPPAATAAAGCTDLEQVMPVPSRPPAASCLFESLGDF